MSRTSESIKHMLNMALATALNDLEYYQRSLERTNNPEVRALLMVLEESEEDFIGKIEHMMIAGVVDAVLETKDSKARWEAPNQDPFEFASPFSSSLQFQRWTICNETLERSFKAYSFYLSIAGRAKSEVVSSLLLYLANVKSRHIQRLRRVCESFDE